MPKFACTYAYDISCYFDFTVEAETSEEAQQKVDKALNDKVFLQVNADPCPDVGATPDSERVWVTERLSRDYGDPTLDELIEEACEEKR